MPGRAVGLASWSTETPAPSVCLALALARAIMSAASADAASWMPVSPLLAAHEHGNPSDLIGEPENPKTSYVSRSSAELASSPLCSNQHTFQECTSAAIRLLRPLQLPRHLI